jgi:caa(3)-type oxidase subunit IV
MARKRKGLSTWVNFFGELSLPIQLVLVYCTAMALLGVEVILSLYLQGVLAHGLIMGVAICMGFLVAFFFMRLRDGTPIIKIWAGVGVVWLFFMFSLIGSDYFTR